VRGRWRPAAQLTSPPADAGAQRRPRHGRPTRRHPPCPEKPNATRQNGRQPLDFTGACGYDSSVNRHDPTANRQRARPRWAAHGRSAGRNHDTAMGVTPIRRARAPAGTARSGRPRAPTERRVPRYRLSSKAPPLTPLKPLGVLAAWPRDLTPAKWSPPVLLGRL